MASNLINLKSFFKLAFCMLTIYGCSKNSLNTPSYSDNQTFIKNKYHNDKPISPFGNLSYDKNEQDIAVQHYKDYIDNGMYNLYINQQHMEWVHAKRLERLKNGKLNGFKHESVPGENHYYIQKTKNSKIKHINVNEKIYLDINGQIQNTEEKNKAVIVKQEKNEINDYTIKNNIYINIDKKAVNVTDY